MIIPNLDFGGAQESFVKVCNLLAKRYQLSIVVFNKFNIADFPFPVPVIDLNIPPSSNYFFKLYHFLLRVKRLSELKRKLEIQVSISFLEGADYVNYLSKHLDKVVCSIRGSKKFDVNIGGVVGWLRHRLFMPYVYQRVERIVVVNSPIGTELIQDYRVKDHRIVAIQNFYNLARLRSQAAEEMEEDWINYFSNNKTIVTSGRLAPEKGIHFLIQAFAKVKIKVPEARLVIVGDGNFFTPLCQEVDKYHLKYSTYPSSGADVIFAGYQKKPLKFVSRASLFMLPSLVEGFPNALVEAMAIGTPVMTANCPYGPNEIISTNYVNGILVSPFQTVEEVNPTRIEEWSNAIVSVLLDCSLQMSLKENAERRASDFSEESIGYRWIDLIENLTAG